MEFAAYNDFDSDKESSKGKEKKLAVPLPHIEAPVAREEEPAPTEGVIFESSHRPAITAPLFEHMIKSGEDEQLAPKAEQRAAAEDDEEDDDTSSGKPKKGQPAPAAPVTAPPHTEQSPSLQEEFSELIEEMANNRPAEASAAAEPEQPAAAEQPELTPPSIAEYQPWHLPYTPAEAAPSASPPPAGGGGRPPVPPRPPVAGGAAFSPEPSLPPAAPLEAAPSPSSAEWDAAQPAWIDQQRERFVTNAMGNTPAPARFEQVATDQAAINQAEYHAEKRGLRRGLVAGFITGYALKQFLANRKMRRFEEATQKQLNKRNEQIDDLASRQRDYQERLAAQQGRLEEMARQQAERQAAEAQVQQRAQFEQPAAANMQSQAAAQPPRFEQQPPAPAAMPARFEQPGAQMPLQARFEQAQPQPGMQPNLAPGTPRMERPGQQPLNAEALRQQTDLTPEQAQQAVIDAYDLKPQQHIERSAWHNIVVDEKGHEVQGAMAYGDAFQRERQKEQVRAAAFGSDNGQAAGGGAADGSAYGSGYGANGQLGSGQTPAAYDLPAGQADVQHRLERPGNPVAKTLSSPWLWAGIVVLLVAFFVAALI
jgi:hypothetical protein